MSSGKIVFDHIHIICKDPAASAQWYVDILGGTITRNAEVRGAPQIAVQFEGATLLIRGQRPGEQPEEKNALHEFEDFVSHDQWGTDHFGFSVVGDLNDYCDTIRAKGAQFSVEPYEFRPGTRIAYLSAPDGVSIELTESKV